MNIKKTLCKQCQTCETHIYERINLKKDLVTFKYCNGNKNKINKHDYTISDTNNRINILVTSGLKQGTLITSLIKENPKNDVKFLDKDRTNLKMDNLQERPRSCTLQEQKGKTSIFPGVVKNKQGTFDSFIKINNKRTYLGKYTNELDAFHHYLIKCKEIGRKINKTTEVYNEYEKEFDIDNFKINNPKKYSNKIKNIYKRKDSGKYYVLFTEKGKTVFRKQCNNLKEAIIIKKEYLNNNN